MKLSVSLVNLTVCVRLMMVILDTPGVTLESIRLIGWLLSLVLSWVRILFLWKLFLTKEIFVTAGTGRTLSVMTCVWLLRRRVMIRD